MAVLSRRPASDVRPLPGARDGPGGAAGHRREHEERHRPETLRSLGVSSNLAETVGRELADELADALKRIEHCLAQLNDEQVWWRPTESMNSIGNLLLHLAGNVRQW